MRRSTWGNVMDKEVGEDKPTQLFIKSSNMERSIAPVIWNTQNFISTQREKKNQGKPRIYWTLANYCKMAQAEGSSLSL